MSDESYLSADRFFGSICRVAFADFSLSFGQGRMGKAQYGLPEKEEPIRTHFIR